MKKLLLNVAFTFATTVAASAAWVDVDATWSYHLSVDGAFDAVGYANERAPHGGAQSIGLTCVPQGIRAIYFGDTFFNAPPGTTELVVVSGNAGGVVTVMATLSPSRAIWVYWRPGDTVDPSVIEAMGIMAGSRQVRIMTDGMSFTYDTTGFGEVLSAFLQACP